MSWLDSDGMRALTWPQRKAVGNLIVIGIHHSLRPSCLVDITFRRSWRSEDTLPSPAHHFRFERAASGAIYRRALVVAAR
jgi:hypothetical protein